GAIPELRRVPVFFNNQLGYTADLADSIDQVLSQTTKAPPITAPHPPAGPQTTSTALARILQQQAEQYQRAQQALDRHDLGAYQHAIDRLRPPIENTESPTRAPPPPPATPRRRPP